MNLEDIAKITFPESEERAARCLTALKAAAEKCAVILESSPCECPDQGRPECCYDAICYTNKAAKTIRELK